MTEIPKRTANSIKKRLDATARKYGTMTTRLVAQRWCLDKRDKENLRLEIEQKRKELTELENKT